MIEHQKYYEEQNEEPLPPVVIKEETKENEAQSNTPYKYHEEGISIT